MYIYSNDDISKICIFMLFPDKNLIPAKKKSLRDSSFMCYLRLKVKHVINMSRCFGNCWYHVGKLINLDRSLRQVFPWDRWLADRTISISY